MPINLLYNKGDLFKDMNKDAIYLQACNAQGHWGAGIAIQFKREFMKAFIAHTKKRNKCGDGYIVKHDQFKIACLITSEFYGRKKDSPKKILVQTYVAIQNLLKDIDEDNLLIYSPKINSGYFNTPWYATERVILRACEKTDKNIEWVIWEK